MRVARLLCTVVAALAAAPPYSYSQDQPLSLWAERQYNSWENPLHSEVTINDKLVNIFTSDAIEPVAAHIKPGWNTIVVKTTAQEPAKDSNGLIFRIGPARKEAKGFVMAPVLWEFRNDTDWKLKDGAYSHPLGPGVKEVTLSYKLYYAGLENERHDLKAGDYVLSGKPQYNSWNSPVVATIFVNGTALNTFMLAERDIVITPFLKPGRNEIKIVSGRVPNAIANNDVKFSVGGPAEWEVSSGKFMLKPIVQFNAMQGWQLNRQTGQLSNPLKADADTIERVIPFVMKTP
jgi:hypothetical protein